MPNGRGQGCQKAHWPLGGSIGDTDLVWGFGTLDRRTPGAGLLAPLNATAYVAWLAAASSLLGHMHGEPIPLAQWALGLGALLLFLIALAARGILEERSAPAAALSGAIVLQAAVAPVALWTLQDHLQAVLLVLVAAQLPSLRDPRLALVALALANCALFVWLAQSESAP